MEIKDLEFVQMTPDPVGAMLAVSLASDMLVSAKEKMGKKEYEETLENSLHSIRAAASAVLMRQGCISSTYEGTVAYLSSNFPDDLALGSWESLEKSSYGTSRGIIYSLLRLMGIIKKADEQQAKQAIITAEKFLASVQDIMGRV